MKKYFSAIQPIWRVALALAVVVFLLSGCASTKVTSVWVDEDYQGDGIDNVFVVGVSKDSTIRRIFEDEFVSQLEKQGVKAAASHKILSDDEVQDDQKIDSTVKESDSDTILITRLINMRKDTQYVPPDYVYAPPPHSYGGWHGYYSRAYMVTPGYTVEYEIAVLEITLYDLKTDKLLWSARSDAATYGKVERHIKEFAQSIISQLTEAKLIK